MTILMTYRDKRKNEWLSCCLYVSAYGSVCWGPNKWPSLKPASSILRPSSKTLDYCPFQLLFHLSLRNTRRGELAILLLTFIFKFLGEKKEITGFDHRMKGQRKKSESIWHLLFPLCVTHVRKILTCLHDICFFFVFFKCWPLSSSAWKEG